ncbi:MAG: NrdJb [Candidatus Competibacteraceae bacterium]|nr:NrdJb [Candidatus Competibacteraceae bacterium]
MTTIVSKSITACHVVDQDKVMQHLHEKVARPEMLSGTTYKIKTPLSEHALYVTINNIILNINTPNECIHPFEIFINSKAMEHFQWIVSLTRIISATFRKGGDVTFLIEELRSVFDPKGGYFKKGGKYMPSLVAEIGEVIEQHLTNLGLYTPDNSLAIAAQEMLKEKTQPPTEAGSYCLACGEYAVVKLDGCATCKSCGDSKCG